MPFDPNFLMQAMLATGSGLNPDPWVQNLAGLGSDTLQSENMWKAIMGGGAGAGAGGKGQNDFMMNLLKSIMSGEKVTDSKLTLGDDGMKIDLSPKMVSEHFGGGGAGKMGEGFKGTPAEFGNFIPETFSLGQAPNVTAPEPSSNLPTGPGVMDILKTFMGGENPSVSQPGTAMPNLAGLTPKDIASAFEARANIEQLKQSREALPSNIGYKKALTQQALATAKKMNLPKDERTKAIQNYEYAVEHGYNRPFEEFVNPEKDPNSYEEWKRAVKGGYAEPYHVWKKEMTALGGGLSLEEKVTQKKSFGSLKGQLYFKDPKWIDDLTKHMSSKEIRTEVMFADDPVNTRATEKAKYVESKISAGGGVLIEDTKWSEDGKTMIWTVKWPSGDVETIRYAVRD